MPTDQYGRYFEAGCSCSGCRNSQAAVGIPLSSFYVDLASDEDENDEGDDGYDDDGYDDDGDESSVIRYHDYRPRPEFRGDGPVFLGMELEVESAGSGSWTSTRQVDARYAQNQLGGLVYLKEDSSIADGFEIVTHPMSYAWAMEWFPWEALNALRKRGLSTHESVGIHVHVSKEGFSGECHAYRWMKFVYRNAPQVQRLARRENGEWASFDPSYRAEVKRYIKGGSGDRYQAINPNNKATFEVRVFASSLRPNEVKAALAFVAGTVEYTRSLDASKIIRERGWAWDSFVTWLRDHEEYAPLLTELEALACVS